MRSHAGDPRAQRGAELLRSELVERRVDLIRGERRPRRREGSEERGREEAPS